jgi:hypothetical protein
MSITRGMLYTGQQVPPEQLGENTLKGMDYALSVGPEMVQGTMAEGPQGAVEALRGREYGLKDITGEDYGPAADMALDVFTDPGFVFGPIKSMAKGVGRIVKDAPKAYSDVASSLSNFIDGFYGSSAGSKQGAVVAWLPQQLKNVMSTMSPNGMRALEEYGMTKPMIDMTANFLKASKSGDTKALKKAYAQVQHGAYMMHRAGVEPKDMPPMYQRMIDSMSLDGQGFMPLSKETYLDEIKNIPYATKKGTSIGPTNPDVASKLFETAQKAWGMSSGKTAAGMPVDMIIRRPDVMLGDFASDVSKSGMTTMLAKVFKGGTFDDVGSLMTAMEKQLKSASGSRVGVGTVRDLRTAEELAANKRLATIVDPVTGKTTKTKPYVVDNLRVGDDGVYFNYRGSQVTKKGKTGNELASRSYLEGGINMQVHVDKKGNVTAVTSDNYDFYEDKIKATEKLLPKGILGITPPIRVNILRRRTGDQIVNAPKGVETFGKPELEAIASQVPTSDTLGNAAYGTLGVSATPGMITGAAQSIENMRERQRYTPGAINFRGF